MKNNTLKKLLALGCAAVMAVSMTACSKGTDTPAPAETENGSGKTYKIAIVKQMDHPSLDEIANAVAARLDRIATDNSITIEYEIYSGQGEQTTLKQIGDQAITDKVDAIIPYRAIVIKNHMMLVQGQAGRSEEQN